MGDLENFNIEDGGKVSEGGEGVSEVAMGIVQENIKKSKKVQAQIQQQSAHNNDLALMLSVILNKVDDNEIIKKLIYLINEDIDIFEIFSLFLPFCAEEIKLNQRLSTYFKPIESTASISGYSDYIKSVLNNSKTLNNIEKSFFIDIIYSIVVYFDIGNINNLIQQDANLKDKIMVGLQNDIYK